MVLKEEEPYRAKNDLQAHAILTQKIQQYLGRDFLAEPRVILDLGCGKHFPHTLLFALDGHHVVGLDSSYIFQRPSLGNYFASLKANGFVETSRFVQLDLTHKRINYQKILLNHQHYEAIPGLCFHQDNVELLTTIKDNSADIVVSKDLFEHLEHPELAVKRIFEVLKNGGITVNIIHLFTSISGGHNPQWANFSEFEPWDHLRGCKFVLPAHLNKFRAKRFVEAFSNYFEVHVSYSSPSTPKASDVMSDQIWSELTKKIPDLHREEVLNEKLVIVGLKRS
ncbi:MAG: class I SAM-dependent methyltransferase [Candidatus Bathyarchaeota archaeon]|nr:class I SAM-dependent methyltransferase [Candidatus Bathyarchaeota archaeon]